MYKYTSRPQFLRNSRTTLEYFSTGYYLEFKFCVQDFWIDGYKMTMALMTPAVDWPKAHIATQPGHVFCRWLIRFIISKLKFS